jgi:2-phosphosulfolactate phosphatase
MKLDVAFHPGSLAEKQERFGTAVVVDVLRASSSIITALENGASSVVPVSSIEEAFSAKARFPEGGVLLCGERGGTKIPGFDLGNSPREYAAGAVGGKILIFASTNGSKAVLAAGRLAERVLIGGFINGPAAARAVQSTKGDCLIACAGRESQFSMEDAVCAGFLAQRILLGSGSDWLPTDEARAAMLLYGHFKDDLTAMAEGSVHGRFLSAIGFGADIPLCTTAGGVEGVPAFDGNRITLL